MDIISRTKLLDIVKHCEGPAVKFYLPTYVAGGRKQQSPIRLNNLYSRAKNSLSETEMGTAEIKSFLKPVQDLIDDEFFWQQQTKGLVLFLDTINFHLFQLPEAVEEGLFIGSQFHITPLIPIYQGNGVYFLLVIDQEQPKLMEGSKFHLVKIDTIQLPESLQEMFDDYYEFHKHLSFHTSTSSPNPDLANQREGQFFGQSGGDDIDKEAEIRNFFHRFDNALMDFLGDKNAPLVLAGTDYLHHLYRQANTYVNLIEKGIDKKVDQMPIDELHQLSWQIVKNKFEKDIEQALDAYYQKESKNGETTTVITKIVPAAYYKQIQTLYAAENQHIWGKFTPEENLVHLDEEPSIINEDLINFAATHTLINGGQVLLINPNKMPHKAKSAALLRYSM